MPNHRLRTAQATALTAAIRYAQTRSPTWLRPHSLAIVSWLGVIDSTSAGAYVAGLLAPVLSLAHRSTTPQQTRL